MNGSELVQLINAPPWLEKADASSFTDSVFPTPVVLPFVSTFVITLVVPVPLQFVELPYTVFVSVKVTPAWPDFAFTLPSVNVV